jgi:hypothetical protein
MMQAAVSHWHAPAAEKQGFDIEILISSRMQQP